MAVYQRKNSWYIDFLFRGQRIRESVGPVTRKLALAIENKRKTQIIEGEFLNKKAEFPSMSFHELGVRYIQWSKGNHKELTYRQNICKLRRLEPFFKDKNVQDVTQWDIEKWKSHRKEMIKSRGKNKGQDKIGKSTLNAELRLLKHLFNKGMEWDCCKINPAKNVKLARGENIRTRFLSLEEITQFFSHCDELLRSICTLILHTGLRKSEALSLKWNEVDLIQNILTVTESSSKSHKARQIPLNETAQQVLRKLPHNGDYLFSKPNGKPYTSIQKMFDHARKAAGLEDVTLHCFRRTFASFLAMASIDLVTIQQLLGHSNIQMTMRYAFLTPQHRSRAVGVLDKKLMSQNFNEEKPSAAVIKLKR